MKQILFLCTIICAFGLIGCDNNQKQPTIMNESQAEEWRQKEHPNEIAVEITFTPTVDIDLIENLSLEDLVMQNCFPKDYRELKEANVSFTYEDYLDYLREFELNERIHRPIGLEPIKLKHVPKNSNLAKAYCIQSPFHFKEFNSKFCYNVNNERDAVRRREEEQKAQSTWDKYLE